MRCHLHLVGPLGFRLDERALRRAGLDYWPLLSWSYHENLEHFVKEVGVSREIWCVETGGGEPYHRVKYSRDCVLVFGSETCGLGQEDMVSLGGRRCFIPMMESRVRSLNLSNCVAVVLMEALRQCGQFDLV